MNSFQNLTQTKQDCETLYNSLMRSHNLLKEITAASIERINKEKEKTQSRIDELSEQINDSNRSAVIHQIAKAEKQRLQETIISVTPEEIAAFDAEYEKAVSVQKDTQRAYSEFAEEIKAAISELTQMKSERAKSIEMIDLAKDWIKSEKDKFDRLKG